MADAPKRASNPKRKERRQRSYTRCQARNKRHEARNLERRDANLAELAFLGGTVKNKTFTKEVPYTDKSGITKYKTVEVTKRESPSEALARTKREDAGWTHHIPRVSLGA